MSAPKISERMKELLDELTDVAYGHGVCDEQGGPCECMVETQSSRHLVNLAIAELEQERDQWREAAVACDAQDKAAPTTTTPSFKQKSQQCNVLKRHKPPSAPSGTRR